MMLKGEDLLYSETSPRGKFYYIVDHPGGRSAMGDDPLYDTGIPNQTDCQETFAVTSHHGATPQLRHSK